MKSPTSFSTFREFIAWRTEAVSALQRMIAEYVLHLYSAHNELQQHVGLLTHDTYANE